MSARLKLASRLVKVRDRVRDVAAGELAIAETERLRSEQRVEDAVDAIETHAERAVGRITVAGNVLELALLHHERTALLQQRANEESALAVARAERQHRAETLRWRETDRRRALEARDRIREANDASRARDEQRTSDDLSAASVARVQGHRRSRP